MRNLLLLLLLLLLDLWDKEKEIYSPEATQIRITGTNLLMYLNSIRNLPRDAGRGTCDVWGTIEEGMNGAEISAEVNTTNFGNVHGYTPNYELSAVSI